MSSNLDDKTHMAAIIIQRNIIFKIATESREFDDAKNLFQQYAQALPIDLSFQNFNDEIKTIDKQYNKPEGALLLACDNEIAIGCAGIRQFNHDTAELKRMFVLPEHRQYKIGRKRILLDTLPSMIQAQKLYRSFGFYEIPPYRFNPVSGAVFMEKKLE